MFRVEKSFTIVFLDLDGFKDVNDTYGHGVGDEVLKWIAQKLKEYFPRSTDTITRWGGDEFAMILGMVDMSQIPVIAYKLEEFLREISDIIDISQIAHDYEGIVSI
ncbi:MAG: GGDEF domain-containing protein [Candidatus Peribacteria bacterium]|nr:MAG: GGDEF domain-containing protein [Candidatus Peribacteria bacterium]